MEIKITQKGVFNSNGEELPIGTVLVVDGVVCDETGMVIRPDIFKGKAQGAEGQEADKEESELIANPDDSEERMNILNGVLEKVEKGDESFFDANGKPKVGALNKMLDEGMEPFTSEERDRLWDKWLSSQP